MIRHLLIIGGQRCGTTFLADRLGAHPQIAMARPARPEPKVLLDDEILGAGPDTYRARFFAHATSEVVYAEKSTSYIEHPSAVDRARALLGSPTIIAQLRDPVARAVSNYRFTRSFGLEDRSLERALAENLEGPRDWDPEQTSVSPYAYLERGRYVDHLARWLKAFPETTQVCFFEETTDPATAPRVFGAMYDAIGIDAAPVQQAARVNASFGETPPLPKALEAELYDYFKDSDAALSDLLGRPLPWGRTPATTNATFATTKETR